MAEHGYCGCQRLANDIGEHGSPFCRLDAEQLLKHILGLRACCPAWELLYLWYDVEGSLGVAHAEEAAEFERIAVHDGIRFRQSSYQALFASCVAQRTSKIEAILTTWATGTSSKPRRASRTLSESSGSPTRRPQVQVLLLRPANLQV